MKRSAGELSRIIFGPVSLCDEGYGDQIIQPLLRQDGLPPSNLDLGETDYVIAVNFVAQKLRLAALGKEQDSALLREIDACLKYDECSVSSKNRNRLGLYGPPLDKNGKLKPSDRECLQYAVYGTGIGDMPQYKAILAGQSLAP